MNSKRIIATAGIVAVGLALTGCAAGSSGDASNDDGSGLASAKAAAAELIEEFSAVPEAREPEPLPEAPPTGLDVVFVGCPVPACAVASGEFVKAADELGWNTRVIVSDFTPEAYSSAFDSAVQLQPDFVTYIATQPVSVIESQLQQLKDAGIEVVANSPDPAMPLGPDELNSASVSGGPYLEQLAKLQAAVVIDDAETLDHVVYAIDPAVPSYAYVAGAVKKEIEDLGGTVEFFEINQQTAGTTLPSDFVSFLQRNPDTEYIVLGIDDHMIGVPEALEAAGIPLPKFVGYAANEGTIDYLKSGQQFATVQADSWGAHWDAADIFARFSIGLELTEEQLSPVGDAMIGFKETADDVPLLTFNGVPDTYLRSWKLD